MELEDIIELFEISGEDAIEYLNSEYLKLHAGRANVSAFEKVMIEVPSWEGSFKLQDLGILSIQDALTVMLSLFDSSIGKEVEKEIIRENLDVSVSHNDGRIFLKLPPLTQETRIQLAKRVKEISEETKIKIRNLRREARSSLQALKDDLGEDEIRRNEDRVDDIRISLEKRIEEIYQSKNKSILNN
ncbi:hypothetical protein CL659_05080 [bacterium]|nr:hypothetical protein [bacterium]|tara:strand:- start:2321 stop:2881 length:561 start_codon:yes stop_codon:yes gene_type:complete